MWLRISHTNLFASAVDFHSKLISMLLFCILTGFVCQSIVFGCIYFLFEMFIIIIKSLLRSLLLEFSHSSLSLSLTLFLSLRVCMCVRVPSKLNFYLPFVPWIRICSRNAASKIVIATSK